MDMTEHHHSRRDGYALNDARGIFCTYVCETCEPERRKEFRADIFDDPNYSTDEPVDD